MLLRIGRQGAQGFLAPVVQNERNRLAKIGETFFLRLPLAVGTGYFGAIGDVPRPVLLDDGGELVVHGSILWRAGASGLKEGIAKTDGIDRSSLGGCSAAVRAGLFV